MSEKENFHVDLPENLRAKFRSLERKLWVVDSAIAVGGIIAGLVVSYLLLFISDRFWSTPAFVRMLFTGAGVAVAAAYVWFWANHWIFNRRNNRVLAAIVQQKHRRMGDRLVSAVELTDHDQRPENVSEDLCRAAIDQIDKESDRYNFQQAVASRKSVIYSLIAILILGALSLPIVQTPAASKNALNRWAAGGEERYTFLENGGLKVNGNQPVEGVFYVPRDEKITITSGYDFQEFKGLSKAEKKNLNRAFTLDRVAGLLRPVITHLEGEIKKAKAAGNDQMAADLDGKLTGLQSALAKNEKERQALGDVKRPFWLKLGDLWKGAHETATNWDKSIDAFNTDFSGAFASVVPDPSQASLSGTKVDLSSQVQDGQVQGKLAAMAALLEAASNPAKDAPAENVAADWRKLTADLNDFVASKSAEKVDMSSGRVKFELPQKSKPLELNLRVGDVSRELKIHPLPRPRLENVVAEIQYPEYLGFPAYADTVVGDPLFNRAVGGKFDYLERTMARFRTQLMDAENSANPKRIFSDIAVLGHQDYGDFKVEAFDTDINAEHPNKGGSTKLVDLLEYRGVEMQWVDQFGIAGGAPWSTELNRVEDAEPFDVRNEIVVSRTEEGTRIETRASVVAILRSEIVEVAMSAKDDRALQSIEVAYKVYKSDEESGKEEERVPNFKDERFKISKLATYKAYREDYAKYVADLKEFKKGNLAEAPPRPMPPTEGGATFFVDPGDGPNGLKIKEGDYVRVWAVARDRFLNDRYVVSAPVVIRILTKEEHANIIQQQFENKLQELDDLARRQENLLDETRKTQEMSPEDLANDETSKQIGRQEQEQKEIAEKLKQLAEEIKELSQEALKNPDMDPKDLAKMAEMQQKMQDLANQQMQQAKAALELAMESDQNRQENLENAEKKEQEAVDELKEMAEQGEETAREMYANTLVKRLRKIAKIEEEVETNFKENFASIIGRTMANLDPKTREMVNEAYGFQGTYTREAAELQDEILRFYDSTNDEKFGEVVKGMNEFGPVEKMEDLAKKILALRMESTVLGAIELKNKFNEWADILDPKDDGDGGDGGEGGGEGQPNEDLIERLKELLRLRQAELDLRDKTLKLEEETGQKDAEKIEEDAFGLQFRQLELLGDLQVEREKRGDGEYLPAAQYRMRDAEDELNLAGDPEGLVEAYKWALVAKAKKPSPKIEETIKNLSDKLTAPERKRAEAEARELTGEKE